MIVLENISKAYRTSTGERTVLHNINHVFGHGRSTGILGISGSGKSTLMRLLAGIDRPTSGRIKRKVRVSWPLTYVGGFHSHLSAAENIKFVARIYGEDANRTTRFVQSFAGLGDQLYVPFIALSPTLKIGLSLGLSLAIKFDVYLVDDLTVGADLRLHQDYRAEIEKRLRDSTIIMASRRPEVLREFCQDISILHDGNLFNFPDLKNAINIYHQVAKSAV